MRSYIDINVDNAGFFLVLSENINKEDLSVVMYRKGLVPEVEECSVDECKPKCVSNCEEEKPKPEDYMITFGSSSKKKGGRFYFAPPSEFLTYPSGWYVGFLFFGDQLVRMVDIHLNGGINSTYLTNVERISNCKEYPAPNMDIVFDCCAKPCDLCCEEPIKTCGCHDIPCECQHPDQYITVKCKDYSTACQIEDEHPEPQALMQATTTLSRQASNIQMATSSPRDNAKVMHLQAKVNALKGQLSDAVTQEQLEGQAQIYINQINELTRQYNQLRASMESVGVREESTVGSLSERLAKQISEAYYAS